MNEKSSSKLKELAKYEGRLHYLKEIIKEVERLEEKAEGCDLLEDTAIKTTNKLIQKLIQKLSQYKDKLEAIKNWLKDNWVEWFEWEDSTLVSIKVSEMKKLKEILGAET